jgi:hypothetical protein
MTVKAFRNLESQKKGLVADEEGEVGKHPDGATSNSKQYRLANSSSSALENSDGVNRFFNSSLPHAKISECL